MHPSSALPALAHPLLPGAQLRAECEALGHDAFVAAHPHPWLVQDLQQLDVRAPLGSTVLDLGLAPGPDPERLRRLYLAPHQFGFVPLVRSARAAAAGRLMVGRAPSSDVVLSHPSVSKVHARLMPGAGTTWALADAGSTNGTWLEGRLLDPHAPPVPLPSPCMLKFGSVVCLVLSSPQLVDALRPPTARRA